MAYIGRGTDSISNVEVLDNLTFNGSASYTLQKSSTNFVPSSANNLLISISGVVQQGNFSVSGSTITFDTTVSASDTCDWILHYGTGLITTVADGAITEAKLGSNAVTTAKINNGAITSAKLDSGLALGKIGQVVQSVYSTQLSSTSTTLASTGLSASITPTSTSSKVLVTVTQNGCGIAGTSNSGLYLSLRDNADSEIAIISRYFAYPSNSNHLEHSLSICYLHSPNTTSSYSYSTKYGLSTGTGTAYVQASSGVSTMTLMEVLA